MYNSAKPNIIKSLDTIHNTSLRLALGAFRTSPTSSILAETREMPLSLRREKLSLVLASKIAINSSNPVHSLTPSPNLSKQYDSRPTLPRSFHYRVHQYTKKYLDKFPTVYLKPPPTDPPWLRPLSQIDLSLADHNKQDTNPEVYRSLFQETHNKYADHLTIYTGGSKTNEGAGTAVIMPNEEKLHRLSTICSIFYCEAYAILSALKQIQDLKNTKVAIYTDSKSVLSSLLQPNNAEPISEDIINIITRLDQQNTEVVLIWIPSHVGIRGNKLADRAAKKATTIQLTDHPVSHKDTIHYLKNKIKTSWDQKWTDITTTKLHDIRTSTSENVTMPTNRRDQVIITRLRIGYTRLTHSHLFKKEPPKQCEYCESQPMSVKYILVECHALRGRRRGLPRDITSCLNDTSKFEKILKFINSINLKFEL